MKNLMNLEPIGNLKPVNFPFLLNKKLMVLDVPVY